MIDWLHARKNKGPFPQEYFFRNLSEDFSSLRNWFQIVWNHFFFFESIHFAYLESGVILSLKMITSNCNFFRLLNTHWSIPIEERTVQGFPKCLFYPTLSDFLANSPDRFVKFSPFSPIFFFGSWPIQEKKNEIFQILSNSFFFFQNNFHEWETMNR